MSQCKVINLVNWGKELSEKTHLMKGGERATLKFVPQLSLMPLIFQTKSQKKKKKKIVDDDDDKISVYRKVVGSPNRT